MKAPLIIDQLYFERNDQILLQDININLHHGELLQIRGANGSGKSTLLRMLAGFIEPHNGEINWQGLNIFKQRETYQQQVHYIGHQNSVKPTLTVRENLLLHCALATYKPQKQTLQQIIENFDLQPSIDTQAQYLSAGQQRRISLARLLLYPAAIWILDEPLTALDKHGQEYFKEALAQHLTKNNGIAIVATHHDLALNSNSKLLELGAAYA